MTNNNDTLQKFLFDNISVRGEIVKLHHSYQEIIHQHNYPKPIQKLLGEALTIATLMMGSLKLNGRLSVQFQGQGTLRLLLAQCNQAFELRALAQWQGEMAEDMDLLKDLAEGTLVITIDPDDSTQRYQGIVAWKGSSLAESIENYFHQSEQLQTRIWIAIDELNASGFLLQRMPENHEPDDFVAEDSNWEHLLHLTNTLTPPEMLTLENEVLLHRLYSQEAVRLFEAENVCFRCTCSISRSENAIRMLGFEEAQEELNAKQAIVVKCEFCNKEYMFDRVDVARIFHPNPPTESKQIH